MVQLLAGALTGAQLVLSCSMVLSCWMVALTGGGGRAAREVPGAR